MKENRRKIMGVEGDIYSHTYEGNVEICNVEVCFDGRVYAEIRIDEARRIHIKSEGVTYQYQDNPEIQLVGDKFYTCPKCGNKSLALARTVTVQPSMWWADSFHHYYGLFCPNCWYGADTIYEYFIEGEKFEGMEKRLIDAVNSESLTTTKN